MGLKFLFVLFAIFVFHRFSPLIDANLYLSGYYINEAVFRTRLVQEIVLFLLKFLNPFFVHWIFGLLSLSGFFYYYFRGGTHWTLCLPLLLPSSMIWTSIIGKEAIFYGAFTLALFIWARFISSKQDVYDFICLGIALIVMVVLRPHYALVIFWLFLSYFLIEKTRNFGSYLLFILSLLVIISFFYFIWNELMLRGYGGIDPAGRASRFEFFEINHGSDGGFERYKALIPLGGLLGILGPMPSEVIARPLFFPFILEGILILLFPVIIYFYTIKYSSDNRRFMKLFWVCLFPSIVAAIVIHSPFGLLNPGSAIRWRVNFETLFLIAPALLYFAEFDKDENNSLSS